MVVKAPQVVAQACFGENMPHLGRLHMANISIFGHFRRR